MTRTKLTNAALFLAAPLLATLAVPAAATTQVIEFSYKPSELTSQQSRLELLNRIEKESVRACKQVSVVVPLEAKKRCAEDLAEQFVEAIDDDMLTQLAGRAIPANTLALLSR